MDPEQFLRELLDDKDTHRRNRRIRALKTAMPPALDLALRDDSIPHELCGKFYEAIYEAGHEHNLPLAYLAHPERYAKQARAFERIHAQG